MNQRQGDHPLSSHLECSVHHDEIELRLALLVLRLLEGVPERPPHLAERLGVRVYRHRSPLPEVEHAEFVESQGMIRVGMREQHGIEAFQAHGEKLLSAVRARVDENPRAVVPLEQA